MEDKPARSIPRVCQYLLRQSIKLYPPEQRFWGHAAAAEARALPSQLSMVRWTWGAVWVAVRAGLARLLSCPSDFFLGTNSFLRLSWRSLSPLVLVLSLSMFLVPEFRQALKTTTSMWIAGDPDPGLPPRTFQKLQKRAEQEHDAQTLAFLAMRSNDAVTSLRLADQAVALDPGLTWIFAGLLFPAASQRVEQLEHWDPENAVPYLRHADFIEWSAQAAQKKDQRTILEEMRTGKTKFRALMQRGFAAPRYNSYLDRRLRLDREVMRKQGIAEPMLLLSGLQRHRDVSGFHASTYAGWIITEAKDASSRDDLQPVEDACRTVLGFGQRAEAQAQGVLERDSSMQLQVLAGKELIPVLRARGKTAEAETLGYSLSRLKRAQGEHMILEGVMLDPRWNRIYGLNLFNPGIIIHLAALLFLFVLALLGVTFVVLRVRQAKGKTLIALPRLISYAPVFLFSSALVLLVTYMPFARIFRMYMVGQDLALGKVLPPMNDPELLSSLANLQYPFRFLSGPDVWHALWIAFGVVLATTSYIVWRVRVAQTDVR